jgi:hypothetical protein
MAFESRPLSSLERHNINEIKKFRSTLHDKIGYLPPYEKHHCKACEHKHK